jgi:chromosome segregation ATPase
MGLLQALGLVPSARLAAANERLRKLESKVETLSEKLSDARTDARTWQVKAEEARQRAKEIESEARRELQRAEKVRAEIEKEAAREKKRSIDVPALEHRLDGAEQNLAVARDQLMAIEVKLDILEGAATVLDGRTRTLLAGSAVAHAPDTTR